VTKTLTELCTDFVTSNRIRSRETIYQTDRVIEHAYELIEGICELVGYYVEPDAFDDGN
jgi:hypothetical protein